MSPADLGFLTSSFLIAFALAQLPLGLLLDAYGPRRVDATLLLCAVIGAIIFGLAVDVATLTIGRILLGIGVSGCLMATLKAMAEELPTGWIMPAHGLVVAAGGFGAVLATAPALQFVDLFGWRNGFYFLSLLIALSAFAIVAVVPERRRAPWKPSIASELAAARHVFSYTVVVCVGPAVGLIQGGFLAIQTLWAGPWLHEVAGMDRISVGQHLLVVSIAMVAGYASSGIVVVQLRRWKIHPLTIAAAGAGFLLAAEAAMVLLGEDTPSWVWAAFGFFGTSTTICFAAISQRVDRNYVGRASTIVNFMVFAGAFAFQWAIGAVVGLWEPYTSGEYPAIAYRIAFSGVLFFQLAGLALLVFATLAARKPKQASVPENHRGFGSR